jgi:acetyl esterase/lipase
MTSCHESSASYAAADGSELPMLLFEPGEGRQPLAGIVVFHGGGLHGGSADELAPHCRRLASRGIFAVSAGYRLIDRGAVSIDDCIADVRRAVAHFAGLAAARGLDWSRLASGGSSAGAHLALMAAMTAPDGSLPAPEPGVSAFVALNPVVDLLAYSPEQRRSLEADVARIAAGRLAEYSPIEFVRPGNPPTLIQHGTDDAVAPIGQARRFRALMTQAGNDCVLVEYERAEHAFHYPGPGGHFDDVMDESAEFLLGRLAGR